MKVLVSAPYFTPVAESYSPLFAKHGIMLVVAKVEERLQESDLLARPDIAEIDGILCGDDELTEAVLKKMKRLRVISKWGTGIDSIDKAAAERLNIRVCNTPNAFTLPVADSVLGYMLAFARQQPWMDSMMKSGTWRKIPGRSLSECTLGVVGVGNCGKAVIRRASAFGMRHIFGTDVRSIESDFVAEHRVVMTSLTQLLERSDFVSLNCDLNASSHHIISKKALSTMKPNAVLINTARGPLVDEDALVAALKRRQIAGAALDVFEVEPLPTGHALRLYDNVMLAPHNANSSPAAWERVHENTVKNLLDVLCPSR